MKQHLTISVFNLGRPGICCAVQTGLKLEMIILLLAPQLNELLVCAIIFGLVLLIMIMKTLKTVCVCTCVVYSCGSQHSFQKLDFLNHPVKASQQMTLYLGSYFTDLDETEIIVYLDAGMM